MFDRTTINQGAPYHQSIEVTENRAPTDESVRLLREMESAAKREVIKAVTVIDNSFNAVGHLMNDHLNDSISVRIVFTMNKKKVTTDARVYPEQSKEARIRWTLPGKYSWSP